MTTGASTAQTAANAASHTNTCADPGGRARYAFMFMRRRSRDMRCIAAALLALTLAVAPAAPARADILDCVNVVVPPINDALQATELAAHLAQCVGQATGGDVLMAATIAAMAVMATAGVIPSDTNQCFAAIDGLLGTTLAAVLMASGIFPTDSEIFQNLVQLAQGQVQLHNIPALAFLLQYANCGCYVIGAPEQLEELAEKYLNTAANCAEVFASAAGAVVDFLEAAICGAIEAATLGLYGCEAAGGGDQTCYTGMLDAMKVQFASATPSGKCELGMQCNPCGWSWCGFADPHAFGISPGVCACPAPYTSNYGPTGQGKAGESKLKSCTCDPPNQSVGDACLCPVNAQLKNGACVPCSDHETYAAADPAKGQMEPVCKPCGFGTKSNAQHTGCVNECNNAAGEILDHGQCVKCGEQQMAVHQIGSLGSCVDCVLGQKGSADRSTCIRACASGQVTVAGLTIPSSTLGGHETKTPDTCFTCPENTFATYETANSSKGKCEPCQDGYHAFPGSTQCTPLDCGIGTYPDPDNSHACKACPATQIYIPTAKVTVPTASGKTSVVTVAGHCGCGENQRLDGDTCVCATGAIKISLPMAGGSLFACTCPEGAHLDKATSSCVCASGATLDPMGKTCLCPPGGRIENNKCVLPSIRPLPIVRKDCSGMGAAFINDPKNAARCIRCPGGRVANAARTACVAKPASVETGTGIVVSPKFKRRGDTWLNPQPEPPSPRRACPPRMAPNARGTACVPVLDMPDFGSPGSLPSGAGRGSGAPTSGGTPTRR
jgi:hypothetical protein